MSQKTSIFKTVLIIQDEAKQREDMQLVEHSLLQPALFRGSSEPRYIINVINQESSSIYLLEDNSGDYRNAGHGHFTFNYGDGKGRLLHSRLFPL